MLRTRSLLALIALASLSFSAYAEGDKKIVFVAGPKDHGVPGRHEYVKDLQALKYCLDNSSNLSGLTTQMHTGMVPVRRSPGEPAFSIAARMRIRPINQIRPACPTWLWGR